MPRCVGHLLGQRRMGAARVERQLLGGDLLHLGHPGVPSVVRRSRTRRDVALGASVERSGDARRSDDGARRQVRRTDRPGARRRSRRSRPTLFSIMHARRRPRSRRAGCRGRSRSRRRSTVMPCRIVPGYSVTSRPSCTVTSMNVWRGSSIVTPFSSQWRLVRLRSSRSARASCQRSLTPWVSSSRRLHASRSGAPCRRAPDHVGEVVLALGVVGRQVAQRRAEQVAPERVDARADLADRQLVGAGVALLDDAAAPGRRRACRGCTRP